ncbi:acyl carrier protein [Nannocystaceae bacterium ST9]
MLVGDALESYVGKREQLLAQVRAVLIEDLRVGLPAEQIDPDTPLFGTGLALDSIDAVDLIVGLERRTGVRLADDVPGRLGLRSVAMVVNYLLAAKGETP